MQYLENNKESAPVISSREDLEQINEGLKGRRQTQKEKRAKINSNNIEGMSEAIQNYIIRFEEDNQTMISPEQLQSFIKETATQERIDSLTQSFEGDKSGRAFEEGFIEGETAYLAERQKGAAQKIKVMRDFDKVAKEEGNRHFAKQNALYGDRYFGKVNRDGDYRRITENTLKKLGLYGEVETNNEMEPSQFHRRNHKFYDYIDRVQGIYESSQAEGEDLQQYVVNPSYDEEIGQEERILTPEEKAAEKERLKAAKKEAPLEEVDVSILLQAFGKKKGRK